MKEKNKKIKIENKDIAVIKFAGDSGDGIQLLGTQFANATAITGRDLATLPDYPAEIRAPVGTLSGVSGFQIAFGTEDVTNPGSKADFLIVMNPAALKINLDSLEKGGVILVNEGNFTEENLKKAGYSSNPLEDGSLSNYRVISVNANRMVEETLKDSGLSTSQILKTKNFFMLGILYWMFDIPVDFTLKWIDEKFSSKPEIAEANKKVLIAGYNYAENTEIFNAKFKIEKSHVVSGNYCNLTGNEAVAYALMMASKKLKRKLYYASYPITPASEILHTLSKYRNEDIVVFQAEDEIAAVCSSIGAAFAGKLAATGTSGPGLSLKSEAIGLAVISELPLVVVDVQRGGPSTGLPTKTEQSDLFQALFGRHGDAPLVVMAAYSPADCFNTVYEASRIAVKYMTPVIVLTSAYIAQGSEPFRIPDDSELKDFELPELPDPESYKPYLRDQKTYSRPWACPPMKGYEHRIGGLEKLDGEGSISYDPDNHHLMTEYRHKKIDAVKNEIPKTEIYGSADSEVLIVGWGSTYGAIRGAVRYSKRQNIKVSAVCLKYIKPLPSDLGDLLRRYKKIIVIEENCGHLSTILKSEYLLPVISYNKVKGQPYTSEEVFEIIKKEI